MFAVAHLVLATAQGPASLTLGWLLLGVGLGVTVLGSVLVAAGGFASPILVGTGAFVLAAGVSLAGLRIRPRTLEDLFIELTGRGLRE